MSQLSYFDVKKEYDRWSGDKDNTSLSEYAKQMDSLTGEAKRTKAYNDGLATKINAYIDEAFSPIGDALRPVGEAVGQEVEKTGLVSEEFSDKAGDLASELPRTMAEFTPFFGPVGKAARVAQFASMGSGFLRGKAETGSNLGGAISAATLPAIPAAGRLASKAVQRSGTKALAKQAGYSAEQAKLLGNTGIRTPGMAAKDYGASQAAMFTAGVPSDVAMASVGAGDLKAGLDLLTDTDYWGLQTIGQVPFMGLDIPRLKAEIETGREITQSGAKRRADLLDSLIVPEKALSNPEHAALANQLQEVRSDQEIPSQKGKLVFDDQLQKDVDALDLSKPEGTIALVRTYNDVIKSLKEADQLTQEEIIGVREDFFGDKVIDAETLQKAFEDKLAKGADATEASLQIANQVKNRLKRKIGAKALGAEALMSGQPEAVTNPNINAKGNLRSDLEAYALHTFENAGYGKTSVENFVELTKRTASLFEDTSDVRLALMRNNIVQGNDRLFQYIGAFLPDDPRYRQGLATQQKMIALLDKRFASDETLDQIIKLSTISHELFHAQYSKLKKGHENGTLDLFEETRYQKYQDSIDRFSKLSQSDRKKIIQTLVNTIVPEQHLYKQGARDPEFASLEVEASRSGEETVTFIGQMLSLGVLNPKQTTRKLETMQDALKWTSDELSEFANLQFRGLNDVVEAINGWYEQKMKLNYEPDRSKFWDNVALDLVQQFQPVSKKGSRFQTDEQGYVPVSTLVDYLKKRYPNMFSDITDRGHFVSALTQAVDYNRPQKTASIKPQHAVEIIQKLVPKVEVHMNKDIEGTAESPEFAQAMSILEQHGYELQRVEDEGWDIYTPNTLEGPGDVLSPVDILMEPENHPDEVVSAVADLPEETSAPTSRFPTSKFPEYTPAGRPVGGEFDIVVEFSSNQEFTNPGVGTSQISTTSPDFSPHYSDFNIVPVFIRGRIQGDTMVIYELQSDNTSDGVSKGLMKDKIIESYQEYGLKVALEQARKLGLKKIAIADATAVNVTESHVTMDIIRDEDIVLTVDTNQRRGESTAADKNKYLSNKTKNRDIHDFLTIALDRNPINIIDTVPLEDVRIFNDVFDAIERSGVDVKDLPLYRLDDSTFKDKLYLKRIEPTSGKSHSEISIYKKSGKEHNYNNVLPNLLNKLTGRKPKMVDLGELNPGFGFYQERFKAREFDISHVDPDKFLIFGLHPLQEKLYSRMTTDMREQLTAINDFMKVHAEVKEAQTLLGQTAEFLNPTKGLPEIDMQFVRPEDIQALGGRKTFSKTVKESMGIYDPKDLFVEAGYQLGFVEKLFGNPSQISSQLRKRGLNSTANVIDAVQEIPAQIEKLRTTMVKPFLTVSKNGRLVPIAGRKNLSGFTKEELKMHNALHMVMSNEKAYGAFSDIALLHNELQMKLEPTGAAFKEAVDDGRVRGYKDLDDDTKNNLWHLVETFRQQNQVAASLMKRNELSKLGMFSARVLRDRNPRISTEAAFHMMENVFQEAAISKEIFALPPEQMAEAALRKAKEKNPEVDFGGLNKQLENLLPKYFQMSEVLDRQKDFYFPERRFGEWLFTYKRNTRNEDGSQGTETVTLAAHDKSELKQLQDKVSHEIIPGTAKAINKKDLNQKQVFMGQDKLLESVQEFEKSLYNEATKALTVEDAQKIQELYQPLDKSLEMAQKAKLSDFMKPRALKPGREYLDLFATGVEYYNALSYKLANDYVKHHTDLLLSDKHMNKHPQLRNYIKMWANNLTQNKSKEYQSLKNAIFTYWLGFNPSSMMIEMAQPMVTTTPIIVEHTGSVSKGYKLLGEAYKKLGKSYSGNRGANKTLKFENDPELTKWFNEAIDERVMEYGSIEELATSGEITNINSWRLQQGLKPIDTKWLLQQPLHQFAKYGRGLYSAVSGLNAKISYIIGFDIAREKGLKNADAHEFAKGFIRRTTHSGGEYNRPLGFSQTGKAQSSLSVLYTLNNFTFATLHMMSRLVKDALGNQGLGKAEQRNAQKALATMLGGQFFLAGALGMPLAGAALAVVEEIYGKPIRDDIRTTLASISGNTEMGSMFADVATRGFPTLLGVDAQSRFGLGSILGFSEYQGFDATGFFGAAGGIIDNAYQGLAYTAQGDVVKATEAFVPQALKRPIEMMRTEGKYLDNKGELLVDPTAGEQLAYLIGFRPKRFSDLRLVQKVNRAADQQANKERRDALEPLAENFEQLSGRQIRARLQQLQQESPFFEFDDFDDLANRLTELVMEKRIPLDPMRSGSYASLPNREKFARTFPKVGSNGISEKQRLQLQAFIKGTITGRPEKPSRRAMTRAAMLDRFLDENPGMSVQRAKLTLQQNPRY